MKYCTGERRAQSLNNKHQGALTLATAGIHHHPKSGGTKKSSQDAGFLTVLRTQDGESLKEPEVRLLGESWSYREETSSATDDV